MRATKSVVFRVEGRALTIEVDISEDDLISTMISSLESLIRRGFTFRITHNSKQPLSRSQSMSTRILKSARDLEEWAADVRKLLRVHGERLFSSG